MSASDERTKVSDEKLLREMRAMEKPFATANDLAERVEIVRQSVGERLKRMHQEGVLERERVGARAVVYWFPDE